MPRDLIAPATGFEDLARKRKSSYRVADVEGVLARLREVSTRTDDVAGLDHLTTVLMRSYPHAPLRQDGPPHRRLSGRIPTYRTVD